MTWLTYLLIAICAVGPLLFAAPMLLFAVETVLAVIVRRQVSRPLVNSPPQTAILIPAHNEAGGIGGMLEAMRQTLRGGERMVVVADNCADDTAEVGRAAGAEVLERTDADRRGKGFALAYGIEHLAQEPPEVLVILDADCEISPDAVALLAEEAQRTGQPVQGLYLCHAENVADTKSALSAMAFQFKNQIRPLGLSLLGGPSYLTGSGMAIPWELVRTVPWASGNLVEDMQLGLDFALAGHAPRYFEGAQISSPLPTDAKAARTQRTRWEQGHLRTLCRNFPGLFWQGLRHRKLGLILLALDLAIPPLALLFALWGFVMVLAAVGGLVTDCWWPAIVATTEGSLCGLGIFAAWFVFCRQTIPFRTLLSIPGYILGKLSIYLRFFTRPEQQWVRTQRAGE